LVVNQGVERYPDRTKLLILAAKIATSTSNWNEAEKRWGKVIESTGDKAPKIAWAKLAHAQRMLGRIDGAKKTIEQGIKYRGTDLKIELAEISTFQKDWPTALKLWQQALSELTKEKPLNTTNVLNARFNISVLKRLINIKSYEQQINEYINDQSTKKIAIVTSFTKGYDTLKLPEILDKRFKYIVYTNAKTNGVGIFDIRPLPRSDLDNNRAIRLVKTHPHKLLSEFDLVVWTDASLMIVGDIYPLITKFLNSRKAIGSGEHPLRKNIYEEFQANVKLKKENYKTMKRQIDYYRKQGFEHDDLAENTLLMFNLKHKKLAPALETWWDQISRFSKRDQLSFNYSLAKTGTQWYRLTRPPQDIRHHPDFVWTPHESNQPLMEELIKSIKQEARL
jgi:hypothetical protein